MLLHHGTTRRCAEQIAIKGFAPRKPSRRVWFAQSKGYALRRAKVKARRSHDRPVVLLCELDLAALKRKLGSKRVVYRAGIVSINGSLPVTVLRHAPGVWDPPSSEPELAAWLNNVLGLKACRGIGRGDPGLIRLGVCRIQAASNPYAGKSQPIGETRTRYSRKFRVNRAKGDVCCPHLTAKRDQSDRLLVSCHLSA